MPPYWKIPERAAHIIRHFLIATCPTSQTSILTLTDHALVTCILRNPRLKSALNLLAGSPCFISKQIYNNTEHTLDWYIFSFVLVRRIVEFQILVSLLKACAAIPILVEISFSICCNLQYEAAYICLWSFTSLFISPLTMVSALVREWSLVIYCILKTTSLYNLVFLPLCIYFVFHFVNGKGDRYHLRSLRYL